MVRARISDIGAPSERTPRNSSHSNLKVEGVRRRTYTVVSFCIKAIRNT